MFIFQNGGFTLARIVGNVNVGNDNVGNGKYKESEGGKNRTGSDTGQQLWVAWLLSGWHLILYSARTGFTSALIIVISQAFCNCLVPKWPFNWLLGCTMQ